MASRLIDFISLMSDMASKLDAFTSTSQHCLVSKVTVTPCVFLIIIITCLLPYMGKF